MKPFFCPFTERDGRSYEASSREAFRRHLTVHHGHDYRRLDNGQDTIVVLSDRELTDRLASVRRSQRHLKPISAKSSAQSVEEQNLPPPPEDFDVRPLTVTTATSLRSMFVAPPMAEADAGTHPLSKTLTSTGVTSSSLSVDITVSPVLWSLDDLLDSPDSPIDFDHLMDPDYPWALLDSGAARTSCGSGASG
jgi:hypothetical protein